MLVFLDFEASSLSKTSFPIEIGWVFEDGKGEGHLIKPAPGWTDWDESAAKIHGISRAQLERQGTPHDEICRHMIDSLTGHALFASAPSWDGKWLSVLLRAAGFPRHLLRLQDSEDAFVAAAAARLAIAADGAATNPLVVAAIAAARAKVEAKPVAHRALEDARREREIWVEVERG